MEQTGRSPPGGKRNQQPRITSAPEWDAVVDSLASGTVMVIGATGTGKTSLVRYVVQRLSADGRRVGLLDTDMGQTSVGVPSCLGLALEPPWVKSAALWFIGDVSPRSNLLPTVVGAARLAEWARSAGTDVVMMDTTGLAEGALGRVLKYHKAVAARANQVVAIQHADELEPLLGLLEGCSLAIYRLRAAPDAQDRSAIERRIYRETRFAEHLDGGEVREFSVAQLIGLDWARGSLPRPGHEAGTVVGLLDRDGFCLGLGLIEEIRLDRVFVYSAPGHGEHVAWVQVGKLRLSRDGREIVGGT